MCGRCEMFRKAKRKFSATAHALNGLSGGNPRVLVMFYEMLISKGYTPDVIEIMATPGGRCPFCIDDEPYWLKDSSVKEKVEMDFRDKEMDMMTGIYIHEEKKRQRKQTLKDNRERDEIQSMG